MKKKYKKTIIYILLLFFFLIPTLLIFAQSRPLETEYIEIGELKPETIEIPITEYVKYVFNFAIAFVGLVAFGILVWSGIQYFTSAGKAEVLSVAKGRIKSAYLGVWLLLFSYLILITINPQLVIFHLPDHPEIQTEELPSSPISPFVTTDLLGRIKELAETVKEIPSKIKNTAEKIKELTNKCDCDNTQPLCLCTGGSKGDRCKARYCFAGPGSHPCPNFEAIKLNQKRIITQRDEILYYVNRALVEKEDLELSIEILKTKIKWYNKAIDKEPSQYLEEERDWLMKEKKYKDELVPNLEKLAEVIARIKEPTTKLSKLPNKCTSSVKDQCQASCKGQCHDYKEGCQPDKCSGGNPCPTDEIQKQVGKINPDEINSICDKIITIVNNITKTQQRQM